MRGNPRVVITGVAGFIGSNLADRLISEGYHVVGIDNLSAGIREQVPDEVDFYQIDIRSPSIVDVMRPGDFLFHLAAKNSVNDCQLDPVESASINVVGTVNVFEVASRIGVAKVIYAESAAVYEGLQELPSREEVVRPQSFYAVGKYATRAYAEAYERHRDLRMTALRYFNVYGPRQDYRRTIPPVMSAFIINLLQGRRPTIYGDGNKRRDFIYVDDVNSFHRLCMIDSRTDRQVYNLGSGRSYSVRDIYDQIEAILQTGLEPIYKPDLPAEALESLANVTAACALGWQPRVSLQDGLRNTIDHIREHVLGSLAH